MSHTLSSTPTFRPIGDIAGKLAAGGGRPPRERGPDRRVRANCIDQNEPAAQPWDRNRFGSTKERIATTESLVAVAKELQAEARGKFPRGRVLDLEQRRTCLAAELDALMRLAPDDRPIGRPATIRIELAEIDELLQEHALGITRTDIDVYEALFDFLCFAGTGRWFPSWEAIAEAARCCERSVGRALRRLQHHGLLAWVSRSRRDAEGRRGQTSHAYFLDMRRKMAKRIYERFLQLRARRHKRMAKGSSDAPPTAAPPPPPADRHVADLRRSVDSLGASVSLRDRHLG
jgi:predicted transcriptional regulator